MEALINQQQGIKNILGINPSTRSVHSTCERANIWARLGTSLMTVFHFLFCRTSQTRLLIAPRRLCSSWVLTERIIFYCYYFAFFYFTEFLMSFLIAISICAPSTKLVPALLFALHDGTTLAMRLLYLLAHSFDNQIRETFFTSFCIIKYFTSENIKQNSEILSVSPKINPTGSASKTSTFWRLFKLSFAAGKNQF